MVCFFEFLTPFILGGRNFLISNQFSTIVSVSDAPRGRVQVLFGHQKQQSPPFGSGLPWALKCLVTGQSTLEIHDSVLVLKCFGIREPLILIFWEKSESKSRWVWLFQSEPQRTDGFRERLVKNRQFYSQVLDMRNMVTYRNQFFWYVGNHSCEPLEPA
jgi:hypothetical protein